MLKDIVWADEHFNKYFIFQSALKNFLKINYKKIKKKSKISLIRKKFFRITR